MLHCLLCKFLCMPGLVVQLLLSASLHSSISRWLPHPIHHSGINQP
jgi:hypothetical protein